MSRECFSTRNWTWVMKSSRLRRQIWIKGWRNLNWPMQCCDRNSTHKKAFMRHVTCKSNGRTSTHPSNKCWFANPVNAPKWWKDRTNININKDKGCIACSLKSKEKTKSHPQHAWIVDSGTSMHIGINRNSYMISKWILTPNKYLLQMDVILLVKAPVYLRQSRSKSHR